MMNDKFNAAFASMGLAVRAHVTSSTVKLMSDDRDQLELASSIALDAAVKANPKASIGDAYEGRRSGWVREISYA